MKKEKAKEYKLNMATLNGIILLLIGILVLLTPLFTKIAEKDLNADLLAGALLTIGGTATAAWGLLRKKKIETQKSSEQGENS